MEEPRSPITHHPSPRVLLIQAEWPARALLKAELEERGYDVLGADSIRRALDLATGRGFRPDALVVDGVGAALDADEAERLLFLRGPAPLLLLGSGQYATPESAYLKPTRTLRRPITLGEIADAVAALLGNA